MHRWSENCFDWDNDKLFSMQYYAEHESYNSKKKKEKKPRNLSNKTVGYTKTYLVKFQHSN